MGLVPTQSLIETLPKSGTDFPLDARLPIR